MLVLSRYRDESIIIGDDIVVTVVDVRGDRVRLGIQAPSDVSVHRREIYDAIMKDRESNDDSGNGKSKKPHHGVPTDSLDSGIDTFGVVS